MTIDGEFSGKQVLVTGAAGPGLGRACAVLFARGGAHVLLTDRSARRVTETTDQIRSEVSGSDVTPMTMDVSDPGSIESALAESGPVDVLVNNAAIAEKAPLTETDPDSWNRVLSVNLTGPFLLMRALLPGMYSRGSGCVVNIASVEAWAPNDEFIGSYVASKAGLLGLTRAAAAEAGPYGVRVNAVAPGLMENKAVADLHGADRLADFRARTPLRRSGVPEEVARAVGFLASDHASFITGEVIDVSGGFYFHA
jgi:3-oxoacyl-[acyl-carrier protein] reductase